MRIATYAGKQFALLDIRERAYYDGLPDALPVGQLVLAASLSPLREDRLRLRDSLAHLGSLATSPETRADLARCLEVMERSPAWKPDVVIEGQLLDAGIDPNPDLHSIAAGESLE